MKSFFALLLFAAFTPVLLAQHPYYPYEAGGTIELAYSEEFAMMGDSYSKIEFTTETQSIDGKTYQVVKTYTGDGTEFELFITSYYRTDRAGNIIGRMPEEQEEIIIPRVEDLNTGFSWTSSEGNNFEVVDTDASIETPNGTYSSCVLLQQLEGEGLYVRSYLKRGVGIVAISFVMGGAETLQSYLVENR